MGFDNDAIYAVCAAAVCSAILYVLLKTGWAWSLATDVPTHRSLHTRPTPRVGGVGVSTVVVAGLLWKVPELFSLALATLVLAVVGLLDDRYGLSARLRFAVQIAAAAVVCLFYRHGLPLFLLPFLIIAVVWMSNLYNFMDGADGLAGGMALMGFGAYALGAASFLPALSLASLIIAGASSGFLLFNWPPAKLFLGDAGSVSLGFLAATLGLIGWSAQAWGPWFPIYVFLPFILDATVTLVRRLFRGARVWDAHREHFYQRMIQMDGKHSRPVRFWYATMLIGVMLALWMLHLSRGGQAGAAWAIGTLWAGVLGCLGWRIERNWNRFTQQKH